MRTNRRSYLTALCVGGSLCFAQITKAETKPGFSVTAGLQSFEGDSHYTHDTHPDDAFLPNSQMPGSAGETSLNGRLYFGALGLRYTFPVKESLRWYVEAGGLFGGDKDRHKNANDPRPDANAAFVYTSAEWGLYASTGLTYDIGNFYVGGEVEFGGIFVSSGWDRFDQEDEVNSKFDTSITVGPVVGYNFTEHIAAEAGVGFGSSFAFRLGLVGRF